ncbi:Cof-type HAD-IIB family hydrolase [Merdibacter massiliensis]|uniref:Cof-type HAD-IIB family hydrolase n=1 Tax=Merdibacter massiliensis TaxID=1871030 RepID=UPI00096A446D|nr:Cof-type HAD-IIB family hydrolase [Merdibacter massiliensis]
MKTTINLKTSPKAIKLIAMDLDGTLLDQKENIPVKSIEYLLHLQKKGIRIALCSGRSLFEMKRYAKELQLSQFNGFLIYTNGAGIYNYETNTLYKFSSLRKNESDYLIHVGRAFHMFIYAPYKDRYYLEGNKYLNKVFLVAKKYSTGSKVIQNLFSMVEIVPDLPISLKENAYKLCFRGLPHQIKRMQNYLDKHVPSQFSIFSLSPYCIEINHKNVNKAQALLKVCKETAINKEHVLVFGDSANDHSVFLSFPNSIAMGNADVKTKQLASNITLSNKKEGVYHFLYQYFG